MVDTFQAGDKRSIKIMPTAAATKGRKRS